MAVPPIFKEMTARRLFGDEFYPSSPSSEWSNASPNTQKFHKGLSQQGLRIRHDGFVDWKYNEPRLPYNWSSLKKSFNSTAICFFEFYMMAMSSAGTSASMHAIREFNISQTSGFFVFMTLYLFGQTIGSMVFAPVAEAYGRRNLFIVALSTYCLFSALTAAIPSAFAVGLGRFMTGAAGAVPSLVAISSFEDTHSSRTRTWIIFIYILVGNCGFVLGPIYSAYVSQYLGWRYVFYISTIISSLGIFASLLMHESHIDHMLEMKVKSVIKHTGDKSLCIPSREKVTLQSLTNTSLIRPLQFLFTEPIILCCAVLMILSFSLIYGLTEALIIVYTEFGFSETTKSSLAFLALLLGLLINIIPRIFEQHILEQQRNFTTPVQSEIKLKSLLISCPCLAFGLWLFAWTIPPKVLVVPWEVSMIGLVFVGYATNDFAYILFGYLADIYGRYAASAHAALNLSRTIMAAIFPLFTWNIYLYLGSNVATTIFATIATIFCATPLVIIKYGDRLRQKSRYAHSEWDVRKGPLDEEEDVRHESVSVKT